MQLFGDPANYPLDQDDLLARIREMAHLSRHIGHIDPLLEQPTENPSIVPLVARYRLVGVEVKRLLIRAEEILEPVTLAALAALKKRMKTDIQPVALNRWEKYHLTQYTTEHSL